MVPFLLAIDFMNFTYAANPCSANVPVPVVMRKGEFAYLDKKMAVEFYLHVDSTKEGSLQNNTRQAVVVLSCDYPVGGTAAAYLFDERKSTAVLLGKIATADWGADWGQGPSSIHVRFAKHVLYVDQCDGPECTGKVLTAYALRSGRLLRVPTTKR